MAQLFKCKVCGKESVASLCDADFLEEVMEQLSYGETNPSKIIQKIVQKFGRLRGLRSLKVYQTIFGPKKIRRVITTEAGTRCRLVPTTDGYVAVAPMGETKTEVIASPSFQEEDLLLTAEGSRYEPSPTEKRTVLPQESTEGKRIVTYYEGDAPVHQYTSETSLVSPRYHAPKRVKKSRSSAPPTSYRSPLAGDR